MGLSQNGSLLVLKESDDKAFSHGEDLTLYIQSAIKEAGIGINQLSALSIAGGPGSYTGLRIGASTAKGLCYALKIPLIAIDTLTCLAAIAQKKHPGKELCAVVDARRMEVYNRIFDHELRPLKEISADIINSDTYRQFDPFVCFGDGAEKLQEIWRERNVQFDLSIYSSARGQVELAYEMFRNSDFADVAYWEPFYLKDFVAGQKKK